MLDTFKPPPQTTGNDLPDDIWRIIAKYVDSKEGYRRSSRLMSLNRTFFHVILTAKYGEIYWFNVDAGFLHIIKRLQNPIIAGHVRKLHIRAWFIQYLLQRDEMLKPPSKARNWICSPLDGIFARFSSQAKKSAECNLRMEELSSKDIIKSLVNAVNGMVNVTELNFEWRDLPLNKDTQVFLVSARSAFDTSLRKLVLRAQISKFTELLAITNFNKIDELDFHFDYRVCDGELAYNKNSKSTPPSIDNYPTVVNAIDPELQGLNQTVIPFIHHRQSYLRSLYLSSSSYVDLAPFFESLPVLPALRSFAVEMSFNKRTLSKPSGLLRILQNQHSTLRRVKLIATWQEIIGTPCTRIAISEQKRKEWLVVNTQLLSTRDCLKGLQSLQIPFVSLEETLPLLNRSSDTLARLRLDDYYLSLKEATGVVDVFSHRPFELQNLHMKVSLIDLALMTLLASKLPGLSSLVLVYAKAAPEFIHALHNKDMQYTSREFTALADWKLCELGLYEAEFQPPTPNSVLGNSLLGDQPLIIMRGLMGWIPNLGSCRGSGPHHTASLLPAVTLYSVGVESLRN